MTGTPFVPFDEFDIDNKYPIKSARRIIDDLKIGFAGVESIVAGPGLIIDATDPANPIFTVPAALVTLVEAQAIADAADASADAAALSAIAADGSADAAAASALAASGSASSANANATTATTQAGIATTQAGNASTSAGTATTQAGNAATSAGTATTQAGISTAQAVISTAQAVIATAQASDAADSAAAALVSENAAAASVASFAGIRYVLATVTSSGTAIIPLTDDVPLSSDGTQIFSQVYTPTTATKDLAIDAFIPGAGYDNVTRIVTLFVGSTCVGVGYMYSASGNTVQITAHGKYAPANTDPLTISVRVGCSVGVSFYVNGGDNVGTRKFGGVQKATLTIREVTRVA